MQSWRPITLKFGTKLVQLLGTFCEVNGLKMIVKPAYFTDFHTRLAVNCGDQQPDFWILNDHSLSLDALDLEV